jgi:hypothetical protein
MQSLSDFLLATPANPPTTQTIAGPANNLSTWAIYWVLPNAQTVTTGVCLPRLRSLCLTDNLARCSITGFLITSPRYRTCTTCPAIALLPSRISDSPPIAVDPSGQDKDYKRFLRPVAVGEEVVQEVLESCSACIMCGGRWARAT